MKKILIPVIVLMLSMGVLADDQEKADDYAIMAANVLPSGGS